MVKPLVIYDPDLFIQKGFRLNGTNLSRNSLIHLGLPNFPQRTRYMPVTFMHLFLIFQFSIHFLLPGKIPLDSSIAQLQNLTSVGQISSRHYSWIISSQLPAADGAGYMLDVCLLQQTDADTLPRGCQWHWQQLRAKLAKSRPSQYLQHTKQTARHSHKSRLLLGNIKSRMVCWS